MPGWLIIVLLVLLLLIAALAIGGYIANRRRTSATEGGFRRHLLEADSDLAAAHAADRGWARERLEAAATRAWEEHVPGETPGSVALVQVVDEAGTDKDKAVFEFTTADRPRRLTLGRRGDEWVFEGLD